MTDTIIKGTGNSRSIKAPANLKQQVTDLDSLLDLLIAGLPCDIGPLNEAGLQQRGDDLNKANLLKDATAALYGLTGEAVLDEVLAKARELITAAQNTADQAPTMVLGSYTGDGGKSEDTAKTLTFSFVPQIVMIPLSFNGSRFKTTIGTSGNSTFCVFPSVMPTSFTMGYSFNHGNSVSGYGKKSNGGKSISWYHENAISGMNESNVVYYYIAFG